MASTVSRSIPVSNSPAASSEMRMQFSAAADDIDALQARTVDSQAFVSGNAVVIAPATHAATSKATPVDADEVPLVDSAATFGLKRLTWANLKATVKTYLDAFYPSGSGSSTGTNTGDNAVNTLYSGLATNATHTGDATGATALTLATVNSNVGAFTNASVTVNAKGLVTAASSGAALTPAGSTGQIQVNTGGAFSASSGLTYTTAGDLTVNGVRVGKGAGAISSNTAIGATALNANTTGALNTALGSLSLTLNSGGNSNTAIGNSALASNTTGGVNTAIGHVACFSNQTGDYNTAGGYAALYSSTASNNVALGYLAGFNNTTGEANTYIGASTGGGITTGAKNTVIGANVSGLSAALSNNIILADGDGVIRLQTASNGQTTFAGGDLFVNSVRFGRGPGSISSNTVTGNGAGAALTTASATTVYGFAALAANTTSAFCSSFGWNSLGGNTGSVNDAFGANCMNGAVTGTQNVAFGSSIFPNLTSGNNNTGIGRFTGAGITTGSGNTVVGANVSGLAAALTNNIILASGDGTIRIQTDSAGKTTFGADISVNGHTFGRGTGNISTNVAAGSSALNANTSGTLNTAVGASAFAANTTGGGGIALGASAGAANTTGNSNVALGHLASATNSLGSNNLAIGANALQNATGSINHGYGTLALFDLTTGANNLALGYNTGRGITTGSNNVIIGHSVTGLSTTLANNVIIADGAGNQRINVGSSGNVGIAVTNPGFRVVIGNQDLKTGTTRRKTLLVGTSEGDAGGAFGLEVNITGGASDAVRLVEFQTGSFGATNAGLLALQPYGGTVGIGSINPVNKLDVDGTIKIKSYTVGTLPSAATLGAGSMAYVTDSLAPTYNATVMAGGAVSIKVTSDGTNWKT